MPTIVQYELSRWLAREMSDAAAARAIAFSKELRRRAADDRHRDDSGRNTRKSTGSLTADAIIFATAAGARADLLTCDAHFAKLPRVVYVGEGIAMSGRPFFVPMIGIVLLFAGLGPADRRSAVHSPFHRFQDADRS